MVRSTLHRVYLSRRNLLTLLNKLDRTARGHYSACAIVKSDTTHACFPCSGETMVIAVEDSAYYADRPPGQVADAPVMGKTLDEIKDSLPADRREKIEQRTADLVDEIERLKEVARITKIQWENSAARLAEAERLLIECGAHEGAEGWSDYLRKDFNAFFAERETE